MSDNFYDSHYQSIEAEVHRQIRAEVFSEDLGQTSWITADECRGFIDWLGLESGDQLLEVACGSGGVSTFMAGISCCNVVGIDINEHAIAAAGTRAGSEGLATSARFSMADASGPLDFKDEEFSAIFCNDAVNHLKERPGVLREWNRILQPGGRLLYTDPIVVTGTLTNQEIAIRSSIGFFLFTPAGENEKLLNAAGFDVEKVEDRTDNVADVSRSWHQAREARRVVLTEAEGESAFVKTQEFLAMVHRLSNERRLSRFAYLARKGDAGY